jgi:hypothetical protein
MGGRQHIEIGSRLPTGTCVRMSFPAGDADDDHLPDGDIGR